MPNNLQRLTKLVFDPVFSATTVLGGFGYQLCDNMYFSNFIWNWTHFWYREVESLFFIKGNVGNPYNNEIHI